MLMLKIFFFFFFLKTKTKKKKKKKKKTILAGYLWTLLVQETISYWNKNTTDSVQIKLWRNGDSLNPDSYQLH